MSHKSLELPSTNQTRARLHFRVGIGITPLGVASLSGLAMTRYIFTKYPESEEC